MSQDAIQELYENFFKAGYIVYPLTLRSNPYDSPLIRVTFCIHNLSKVCQKHTTFAHLALRDLHPIKASEY